MFNQRYQCVCDFLNFKNRKVRITAILFALFIGKRPVFNVIYGAENLISELLAGVAL
jgi:hypothetical protein